MYFLFLIKLQVLTYYFLLLTILTFTLKIFSKVEMTSSSFVIKTLTLKIINKVYYSNNGIKNINTKNNKHQN